MNIENAENLSIQALTWLSTQTDLLGLFLGASGADIKDLKQPARYPAFLGAVLDFLLMDDRYITAFCDGAGLPYNAPMLARGALPGGTPVNWT